MGAARTRDRVDENEWARLAAAGDEAAFESLVNRFSRAILDYCRRMAGDAFAEDLAQETFVKFYFALPQYDPAKPVSPYLYRIAHNHCLDHLRKKKLETLPLVVEDGETGAAVELDVADDKLAPDELVHRAEVQQAVDDALASLPPIYRSALVMRYREGLAYEEIATALDLPLGTVKAQIHRGREKLQQKLAAYV
jgi:RNA polymerase sigma-70 factor (ECF subfamily)